LKLIKQTVFHRRAKHKTPHNGLSDANLISTRVLQINARFQYLSHRNRENFFTGSN